MEEFNDRFLALYKEMVRASNADLVHTVYVQIMDQGLLPPRGKKRFKAWFMELVKQEWNRQFKIERKEFGMRRTNKED